jgi:class 3 adenylate cyclase
MYFTIKDMEEDIAILMADLSGYTALTETHGPHGAADIVEKYIRRCSIVWWGIATCIHLSIKR